MKKYVLLVWLLLSTVLAVTAQQRRIEGTVTSTEKGETLPGVTVVVKGTTIGATTDGDGKFGISVPAGSDVTLRVSYVGYTAKDVVVGSQNNVTVQLSPDTKALEEVVVIGYQQVNRRDVTGSVSSVSAQQIKDVPVNSAAEALTGRLAGVQVTSAEGTPGNQNVQIRVRGGGSITQDNSPLYVVDGVQVENALNVISPQDIASVDVLKDAAATAIYGARGANGVVIITTKSGKEGRTVISYNGFAGVRKLSRKLDLMQPADFVDYQYERALSANTLPSFKTFFGSTNFAGDTLQRDRNLPFLDWQDKVFGRDAFQQTHNLSIAGGSKNMTYSLSLTRNGEKGIQLGSDYTRNLVNLRLDNKVSDKFSFGLNVRFNDQVQNGLGTSSTLSNTTSRLRNAVIYLPLAVDLPGALDPNVFDEAFSTTASLINPVVAIQNDYRRDKRRNLNLGGNIAFSFTKDLVFRSTVGFDLTNSMVETFAGRYSPAIRQPGGGFNTQPYAAIASGQATTINQSNVLTYSFKKNKHSLDALLGQEIYTQVNTTQNIQVNFLPLNITAERAIANINQGVLPSTTSVQPNPSSGRPVDSRLLSGFTRLNYSFDDKYLLTGTLRADASSKFRAGQRVGYFPAASVAWRISREEFMKSVTPISDLKLRLSYGLAGNNRINDFLFNQLFQVGGGQYALNENVVLGTTATGLPNTNLKWETTVSRNVGVDLSLFNNRVQFTADVYKNTTRDLLVNVPIPPVAGYSSQLQNIGSTSNRGIELQLSGSIIQGGNFTWSATANTSLNRGRIESLGPITSIPGIASGWASTAIATDYLARVGDPVGLMYGYVTDFDNGRKGFYTVDDFEGYNATTKTWTLKSTVASDVAVQGQTVAPGIVKLKDLDGNGVVNDLDRTVIGNANPKLTGGLNQQFTYKGFDASIFVNFVLGNDIYNANKLEFTTAGSPFTNLLGVMKDRYRTVDANGALITSPEVSRQVNQNAQIWQPTRQLFVHSWAIEDGSFLRLNNITLGYSLPKALIERIKLTQLRFYVTANNLYTFTKYSGYDPEVNTRRNSPLTPGMDFAGYPRSRVLLLGVNLSL
ncbi:TonB-dependent receptor [Hymenobacter sp. GOD-10R]|uniref:SusC/RagA family TonB-linked outer membrane protein n=1 Tax=Hymenobacter sp. GOD-10R TaxID=3093922 RepID=UPI002D78DE1A|nr:TonB-dependent receptor [Hymenobacter sp. GOD-10R]WRQ27639.1 TonB-dependent receptor [Hymenobacter sp. GOD-10R]